jgi:hypothetical protein
MIISLGRDVSRTKVYGPAFAADTIDWEIAT